MTAVSRGIVVREGVSNGEIVEDMPCPHCGGIIGVTVRVKHLSTPLPPPPTAPIVATAPQSAPPDRPARVRRR